MKPTTVSLLAAAAFFSCSGLLLAAPLVYEGEAGPGKGKGKHVVLIASDHEYKSEEIIPALARILAKHQGFKCTVLFGVDPKSDSIRPGNSNIHGTET